MSVMVDQVAEALAQSFRDTVARVSGDSWEATGVTLPSKEVFERYARAAIAAMREPTNGMLDAGYDRIGHIGASLLDVGDDWLGNPTDVWQAMLDEALKP